MRYIAIKGLDRGGTNALLWAFHYQPSFFSLSEKTGSGGGNVKNIPLKKLWNRSMFLGQDNLSKDKSIVKNIVFKKPRGTETRGRIFRYKYYPHDYDKTICLVRNPLRVYVSQCSLNKRRGKGKRPKWDYWRSIINQTYDNVDGYSRVVIYEHLLKHFDTEFSSLLKWIDPEAEYVSDATFWKKCSDCKGQLVNRAGRVQCESCHKMIAGHGGFNPAPPLEYERAVGADLREAFKGQESILDYAKQKFGEEWLDYWLNDKQHGYEELPRGIK